MNTGAAPILLPVRLAFDGATSLRFPSRYVRFGAFELDIQKQELYRGSHRIKLQTKIYEALLVLLENPSGVVSREVLRQRLWPGESLVNLDANVNTTVNKLRQVLGDSPVTPAYVETIPRKGYSFVGDVTFAEDRFRAQESQSDDGHEEPAILFGMRPRSWLAAAVVALVLSGMLLGAAIMLYTSRAH